MKVGEPHVSVRHTNHQFSYVRPHFEETKVDVEKEGRGPNFKRWTHEIVVSKTRNSKRSGSKIRDGK